MAKMEIKKLIGKCKSFKRHAYTQLNIQCIFFLMNDTIQKEFNEITLNAIYIKLQGGMQLKSINLLQEIMDKSKTHLQTYINNWQHKMILEEAMGDLPPAIVPIFDKNEDGANKIEDYYEGKPLFEFSKMQFTGYSILSEGYYDLEGRLALNVSEMKMKIFVKCAGLKENHLTNEFISYKWDMNGKSVEIQIKIPKEELEKSWEFINTSFRFGTGRYFAELPDEHRYIMPPKKDKFSILSVQDGVLQMLLPLKEDLTKD